MVKILQKIFWKSQAKMEIIYVALILNQAGKPITKSAIVNVLKAGAIDYDEKEVERVVEAIKDVNISEVLKSGWIYEQSYSPPIEEEEVIEELMKKDDEPTGLLKLFG